jgi:hypothetical protein
MGRRRPAVHCTSLTWRIFMPQPTSGRSAGTARDAVKWLFARGHLVPDAAVREAERDDGHPGAWRRGVVVLVTALRRRAAGTPGHGTDPLVQVSSEADEHDGLDACEGPPFLT